MFYLRIFISDGFCSFCWPRSFTEPKKNSGPLNHIEEDVFLFASNPCEASSAGFILDEHCCSHVSAAFGQQQISNFLVLLFMQPNTILLYVQKVSFFHSMPKFLLIRAVIFTGNTAATNFRCGMVTYLFGVTLDFPLRDILDFP